MEAVKFGKYTIGKGHTYIPTRVDTKNVFVYDNVSLDEYQNISRKELKKTFITAAAIAAGIGLFAGAGILAFKSGHFDKQYNDFFTFKDKICNNIRNFIHSKAKQKINSNIDFSLATSPYFKAKSNIDNQISDTREITECIKALLGNDGKIKSIAQNTEYNGVFDISYKKKNPVGYDFNKANFHFHNIGLNNDRQINDTPEMTECVKALLGNDSKIQSISQKTEYCGVLDIANKERNPGGYDFSKANSHFHNIGLNNDGQISGAHEIRECIRSLMEVNGNIIKISQSSTQNGFFDIYYEINGKRCDSPKTVYIKEELSKSDIKNIVSLFKTIIDVNGFSKITGNKRYCDEKTISQIAQEALKNGFVIKKKPDPKKVEEASKKIAEITKKLKDFNAAQNRIKEIKETIRTENINFYELKKAITDKSSSEFKNMVTEHQRIIDTLQKELVSLGVKNPKNININIEEVRKGIEAELEKAEQHLRTIKDSFCIFGEKEGKLFGAYAHKEAEKVIIDSYFPITNGSKMQRQYLKYCLDGKLLTFNDIKCLIGAKKDQINTYFHNLFASFNKWMLEKDVVTKSCGGIITVSAAQSELKARKLSAERKKAIAA